MSDEVVPERKFGNYGFVRALDLPGTQRFLCHTFPWKIWKDRQKIDIVVKYLYVKINIGIELIGLLTSLFWLALSNIFFFLS